MRVGIRVKVGSAFVEIGVASESVGVVCVSVGITGTLGSGCTW